MRSNLGPIIAILVALGLFFGYVNPAWSGSIAVEKAVIANDDQALAAAATFSKKEAALETARDQISPDDLARLSTLLPDSVNNVEIILDLNTLATRSNILLSHADVAAASSGSSSGSASAVGLPASGQGPVGSVDLSLSAVGTYHAFRTFLGGIEKSARILDVESLSVRGSDTGVYSYSMTLRLYWLR